MKTVILAGGSGTRVSEESFQRPKTMIEIGGAPMLRHIMKYYAHYGFCDFIVCCGYKGYVIKEYFASLHRADITFDFGAGDMTVTRGGGAEPWTVTLVDTGSQTGAQFRRVSAYVGEEPFMLAYGDGIGDVDLNALLERHKGFGAAATLTAVRPDGYKPDINHAAWFRVKPKDDICWVNAGFMVMEPEVFGYGISLEDGLMNRLAQEGKLGIYKHDGFWQCMDTLRDKALLDELLRKNEAPWKVW
ncbi:MAG: NTP transferase domain-containing protein [Oscillospiraceae bacterium]|nr:NTP transferase domain-containing protein [Oscillospiraceae bacterium]